MKRTTYIMAGMLLGGLVVIAGFILYMSAHRTSDNNSLVIDGENKTMTLPDCKVVQVLLKQDKSEDDRWIHIGGEGLIAQPASSLTGILAYPDGLDAYLSMQSNGDTLNIVWDFSTDKLPEEFRNRGWFSVDAGKVMLSIPSAVEDITVKINGLTTIFEDFSRDSLSFNVRNKAMVKNCHLSSLNAKARDLHLNSGAVQDLYLNLDYVSSWTTKVDSFQTDTQHLSGSGEHYNYLQKGECCRVLWTPLTEKASLNMKLLQATQLELER